ncbi:sarcosine oxidase subunit gamma [Paracoccus sp. Ld10]|uniref:sarcosine oxidase subunit gamma n=1 Tax=Paracoccus sp. Ld10 TaxID=649158 RepID=UPI00386BC82E
MTDLIPLTALGGDAAADRRFGAIRLTERPEIALASLALRRGAAYPAPFGLALPGPGQWAQAPGVSAFWTGPDQWMIEAPGRAAEDFAALLADQAPGCTITEQTDAFSVVEIASEAGPAPLIRLLEKLVNLNLHGFAPGCATRTGLHHTSVFVIRRSPDCVAVIGMRSFAAALWHALELAATQQEAAAT